MDQLAQLATLILAQRQADGVDETNDGSPKKEVRGFAIDPAIMLGAAAATVGTAEAVVSYYKGQIEGDVTGLSGEVMADLEMVADGSMPVDMLGQEGGDFVQEIDGDIDTLDFIS